MENFTGTSGKELVYFRMDGCPHCKNFDPVWDDICEKVKTKGELGCKKVPHDDSLTQEMGINGFPTIVLAKDNKLIKKHEGERTVKGVINFANGQ